jgi:ech hydrogenase subunit A
LPVAKNAVGAASPGCNPSPIRNSDALVFGSAATLFFWVKWVGKLLVIDRPYNNVEGHVSKDQWFVLGMLTMLTILICAFFSPVANAMIEPYVFMVYGHMIEMSAGNVTIMAIMLTMVALFPLGFLQSFRKVKITDAYLAGANTGQRSHQFTNSLGGVTDMAMKNYYLEDYFF